MYIMFTAVDRYQTPTKIIANTPKMPYKQQLRTVKPFCPALQSTAETKLQESFSIEVSSSSF